MTEISREYAVALFTLAKETDTEKAVSSSLDFIKNVFGENPQYVELLSSPGISLEERLSCAKELLSGNVHEYVESFVLLLCEKGRIKEINKCIEDYESLYKIVAQVSTAYVRSAVPLSNEEKNTLKNKLQGKIGHSVQLECSVDKSIIGGIVVNIDGKVYDGSIKKCLRNIKEVMYK